MNPKHFNFVDVSGVGNAGKSAVVDFLRDIPGFFVPEHSFEFDLFRVPGGLLDLEHHVVHDWSPIRSDRAIKDFRKLVLRMGANPKWYQLREWANASGQRYDKRFGGRFLTAANALVSELVAGNYPAYWPYDWLVYRPLELLVKKALLKLGSMKAAATPVHLTRRANFPELVTRFMNDIYSDVTPSGVSHIVLNNAFEPYNPERCLALLKNAKSIIVYRDPRDVFASGFSKAKVTAQNKHLQAKENDGLNKTFLGADNLDSFILRFDTLMSHMYRGQSNNIHVIQFEKFVRDFENEKKRLLQFLGVENSVTVPSRHFDSSKSARNIGLWKQYSNQDEIRYLERNLSQWVTP